MKKLKNIFIIVTIAFTFVFCDSSQEITLDDNNADVIFDNDVMISSKMVNRATSTSEVVDVYQRDADFSDNTQIQPKIIKSGNLSFETSDLEKTTAQIYEIVKKHKAQIQSDREGKNYQSYYRNMAIRIGSDKFESLIEEISQYVKYFDTKEVSSQDVTEEYIDIQARLKTKKELENRYLELLKKATKVSEMIEIERNLSVVREEIEAKEGQLNYLKNQVTFSTLQVYFYKKTAETGITNSYGSKITNAIKQGFNSLSSLFISFLKSWHIIVFLVFCFWYYNKRKKKKQNKKNEISS